jgi:hypothetical protein
MNSTTLELFLFICCQMIEWNTFLLKWNFSDKTKLEY